jgi:hypothetical protein
MYTNSRSVGIQLKGRLGFDRRRSLAALRGITRPRWFVRSCTFFILPRRKPPSHIGAEVTVEGWRFFCLLPSERISQPCRLITRMKLSQERHGCYWPAESPNLAGLIPYGWNVGRWHACTREEVGKRRGAWKNYRGLRKTNIYVELQRFLARRRAAQ